MSEKEKLQQKDIKETRNYGLDLLRILCMFMILFLHMFEYSGLRYFPNGTLDFPGVVLWWLSALTYVAVDCYVLISGYFLVDQRFRLSKLIKLALEVWFYSIGIMLVLLLCGKQALSFTNLFKSFFPLSFKGYWFVTIYIGMYMLSPLLNLFIKRIDQKQHLGTIVVILILLSLWRDLIPTLDSPFFDKATYSTPLFVELYLIAAYIRRYVDVQRIKRPVAVYFLCTLLIFVVWLFLNLIYNNVINLSDSIPSDYYYRNHSTPVILGAVCLFIAFLKLRIRKPFVMKGIVFIAPLTLGVYLISEHTYLRPFFWESVMGAANLPRNTLLPISAVAVSAVLFCGLLAVDFLRAKLFQLLESRVCYKKTMKKIDDVVYTIYDKIFEKLGGIYK